MKKNNFLNKINNKKILIIFLSFITILSIIYALVGNIPYWDEGVYLSNGKYLFSGGKISTYEYQRPPMMGIILGFFWFIGVNPLIFTKIILLVIFILGLYYLYKLSEKLEINTGILTTMLLASSYFIIFYINRVLTSIAGLSIAIIGYYLFVKKKYFLSGLIFSLAFLFRYTTALIFLIIGIFILINLIRKKDIKYLYQGIKYVLGFLVLTLPFLIINYLKYNFEFSFLKSFFYPLITASKMVAPNISDLTTNGLLFYIKFLVTQNLFIVFFIIFVLLLIFKKKFRKIKYIIPSTIAFIYLIYLSNIEHFTERYFLVALPFFAIISSIVIKYLIKGIKNVKIQKLIVELIILFLIIEIIFGFYISIINTINKPEREEIERYYSFFNNKDVNIIGIDNPLFGIYNNSYKVFYLSGPEYVNQNIKIKDPEYIAFAERNFECLTREDIKCQKNIEEFKEKLKDYNLVYYSYFQDTNHFIYKIE